MICPNCAFPNDPEATQCRKCRQPLIPEVAGATPPVPAAGADFSTPTEPGATAAETLTEKVNASLQAALEKEKAGDVKTAFLICQSVVIDHFEDLPPPVLSDLYLTMARLSEKQQRPDRAEKYRQKAASLRTVAASGPSLEERLPRVERTESAPAPAAAPAAAPLAPPPEPMAPAVEPAVAAPAPDRGPSAPAVLRLAGFGARALATAVDLLVVLTVLLGSMRLAALFFGESLQATLSFFTQGLGTMGLLAGLWLVLLLGYQTLFTVYGGQTAGKMLLRLRIVRRDGHAPSWKHALRRLAGLALCWLSGLAGFLWIGFDGHRQGWHDKLGGTLVVSLGRPAPRERRA